MVCTQRYIHKKTDYSRAQEQTTTKQKQTVEEVFCKPYTTDN